MNKRIWFCEYFFLLNDSTSMDKITWFIISLLSTSKTLPYCYVNHIISLSQNQNSKVGFRISNFKHMILQIFIRSNWYFHNFDPSLIFDYNLILAMPCYVKMYHYSNYKGMCCPYLFSSSHGYTVRTLLS